MIVPPSTTGGSWFRQTMILHQLNGGIARFGIAFDHYLVSAAFTFADRIGLRFDAVFVQNVNDLIGFRFIFDRLHAGRAASGEQK